MAQTYRTQWFSVADGDSQTLNPETLVGDDILINSAQARWEGVDTEITTTDEIQKSTEADSRSDLPISQSNSIPSGADNVELAGSLGVISTESGSGSVTAKLDFTLDYDGDGIGEDVQTASIDGNNTSGETYGFSDGITEFFVETKDGYTGDVAIQSDSDIYDVSEANFRDAEVFVRWDESTTTTESTTNPEISGDVTADSGSITLNDGETSNWYTASGLEPNSETFTHSIDGSYEAQFQLEFTYEPDIPDPVNGTVALYDSSAGVWRECAVADPSDVSLDYNHVSVYNSTTSNWGALDVVDVTNSDAITSHQFYDSTVGWLAAREYSTTSE